jgi:hypothetical protein
MQMIEYTCRKTREARTCSILPLLTLFVGSNSANSRDPSRISTTATKRCRMVTWPRGCFLGLLGTSNGSCILARGELGMLTRRSTPRL